ncbi:MAG TPA: hypothetical protein VK517_16305, partial [Cyclobacteriaceae bacterium]|nr:hypothetical protein [Cyclobacteriaceae bacterium]
MKGTLYFKLKIRIGLHIACSTLLLMWSVAATGQLLKVAVAGMNHDHIHGILNQYKRGEVILAGIAEADGKLIERYKKRYQLPDSLFFKDLPTLLEHV